MAEGKAFLLVAAGAGAAGVIVGAAVIWGAAADLLSP